jgi:hypothetical protein
MQRISRNEFVVPFNVDLQIGDGFEHLHVLIEAAILPIFHVDVACIIDKDKSCAVALLQEVIDDIGFLLIEVVVFDG